MVKDRFIKNVPVPFVQLELQKNPPDTSYDALNRVIEALKVAESCQANETLSNQNRLNPQWNVSDINQLTQRTYDYCRICRQPGHWAKNCPQSKFNQNKQNYHVNNPSISNVIVNSIMQMESLNGTCLLNYKPVKFLFDTGTTWERCKNYNDTLLPISATLETCNYGAVQIIGKSTCTLKLRNFETRVEI
ncbi:hypothetical protein BpHYR1_009290 [Brachionus plicatilis]|uniref:CCHC-type domain-containing protein n=1 Tax=Brachionus plicatilis TaxID=10195 RepID=A0A3M7T2S8_BRAPC|nr:hypothetical protein BpHYR1_009290 [Brachionus plicatilis]